MNWIAKLVGAAALVGAGGAAAQSSCTDSLPAVCLQTLGAGVVRAEGAPEGVDCDQRLESYRSCIVNLVAQRGPIDNGQPPLSRPERGFLAALEAELADNVGRLEAFVEGLDLTGAEAVYEDQWPSLRLRFFNATDNPAYFAAPADWLARTQGFYDDVGKMLSREDVRHVFRRQVTSVLYDRRVAKEKLQALVSLGRDELLPEISAELAAGSR